MDDPPVLEEDEEVIDCNHIRIGVFAADIEEPLALCADTGAPKSVVGLKQLRRILDVLGKPKIPAVRNGRVYRFDDMSAKSLGLIELAIATSDNITPIHFLMDVVSVDIPALLGLDIMDGNCLMVENITNRLWHRVILHDEPLEVADK